MIFSINGKFETWFCASSGILKNSALMLFSLSIIFSAFLSYANDTIQKKETPPESPSEKLLKEAAAALKKKDTVSAISIAGDIMKENEAYSELWHKGADILSKANTIIYTEPQIESPEKIAYIVKQGDTLEILAKDFGVTAGAIRKTSKLAPDANIIPVGKKLTIYAARWEIIIRKKFLKLYLYNSGNLFKVYPVTIGKNGKTPVGTFEIASKIYEPDWTHEGKTIAFGEVGHPLGTRWMNLRPTGDTNPKLSGYGLHGTWRPERIGHAESNGCIRMKNPDVEEIFEIVPYKTSVTIED